MDRKISQLIDTFAHLGDRLSTFGADAESQATMSAAVERNPWFTRSDVVASVGALRTQMLDRRLLTEWLEPYGVESRGARIGIIMAGNIPLVGFFDLLCVVVSGRHAVVKTSSKDRVLMEYVIDLLRKIDPLISISTCDDSQLLENSRLDAIIATGSDNTNRYFRTQFSSIPSLLRGSRYSVAVLTGEESHEQLGLLAEDMFAYSGLGCRNVSRLLVPEGYEFEKLVDALSAYDHINPKYRNNYRQNAALLRMNGSGFIDGGFFTLRPASDHSLYISEIACETYRNKSQLDEWLAGHDHQIQCVVGEVSHPRGVGFGRAQSPRLCDYPDAVDVIEFVKNV